MYICITALYILIPLFPFTMASCSAQRMIAVSKLLPGSLVEGLSSLFINYGLLYFEEKKCIMKTRVFKLYPV